MCSDENIECLTVTSASATAAIRSCSTICIKRRSIIQQRHILTKGIVHLGAHLSTEPITRKYKPDKSYSTEETSECVIFIIIMKEEYPNTGNQDPSLTKK